MGKINYTNRSVVQVRFRQLTAHFSSLRQNEISTKARIGRFFGALESFVAKHLCPGRVKKHLVERPSLALALTDLHFRLVDRSQLAVLAGLS